MPRRTTKKERGVFEKDPGSGIWWIRYTIDGRERREKVGRGVPDLLCRWKSQCSAAISEFR